MPLTLSKFYPPTLRLPLNPPKSPISTDVPQLPQLLAISPNADDSKRIHHKSTTIAVSPNADDSKRVHHNHCRCNITKC